MSNENQQTEIPENSNPPRDDEIPEPPPNLLSDEEVYKIFGVYKKLKESYDEIFSYCFNIKQNLYSFLNVKNEWSAKLLVEIFINDIYDLRIKIGEVFQDLKVEYDIDEE